MHSLILPLLSNLHSIHWTCTGKNPVLAVTSQYLNEAQLINLKLYCVSASNQLLCLVSSTLFTSCGKRELLTLWGRTAGSSGMQCDPEDAEGHFKMAPGMYQYWDPVDSAVVYMWCVSKVSVLIFSLIIYWTYLKLQVISFEVWPLGSYTAVPAFLPLIIAVPEVIFRKCV